MRWVKLAHQPRSLRRHPRSHLSLFARLSITTLEDRTVPSAFTVTTLADGGPGSLRQAILDADAHATGVWLAGASNNRVGTDGDGVGDAGERNVIAGNQGGPEDGGVRLSGFASGNVVAGNYIGTNAAGTAAVGNRAGIFVETLGP